MIIVRLLDSLPGMFWLQTIFIVLVLAFPLWDLLWYALGLRRVLPGDLKDMLHRKGPFIIDVSTPAEYRLAHIPSAVNRPDLLARPKPLPFTAHQPLVVVCSTGHRSAFAAMRLRRMGYHHVAALAWGMLGWKLARGKIAKGRDPRD